MVVDEITDKRIRKSKLAIHDAFLTALETKSMDKISVKELSELAGINRKTFYAHYSCVEDIAHEIEIEIIDSIESFLQGIIINDYGLGPQYFLQFINVLYSSNPGFFEHLITGTNYRFLAEKCVKAMKNQIIDNLPYEDPKHLLQTSYLLEFCLGGCSSMLVEWIRTGKQVPFEEISALMLSMVVDGLSSILDSVEPKTE